MAMRLSFVIDNLHITLAEVLYSLADTYPTTAGAISIPKARAAASR